MTFKYILLFILGAVFLFLGISYTYLEYEETVEDTFHELETVAEQHVETIVEWHEDIESQAESILIDPSLIAGLAQSCEADGTSSVAFTEAMARLTSLLHGHDCSPVLIIGSEHRQCLSDGHAIEDLNTDLLDAIRYAKKSSLLSLSNFYLCPDSGAPRLALPVPLQWLDGQGNPQTPVLLLEIDPTERLYKMLKPWSTKGKTDELGLIRRTGQEISFLSNTRFDTHAALTRSVPLSQTDMPIVRAVTGEGTTFAGNDYRGVPVLSVTLPIPDTDWYVFAEIDQQEALAAWREQTFLLLLTLLFSTVAIYLGGVALWQRETRRSRVAVATAEEALSDTLQRLQEVSVQSRTMTWEVDASGLYTFLGSGCEALTGYNPGELLHKKRFYDLHPSKGREEFKTSAFKVFESKESFSDLPNPIETRAGSIRRVITNGFPLLDTKGNLLGYRGSDRDVTELNLAQQELRNSEERNRVIIEGTSEGLLVADLETTKFVYTNPAMCRLLGYTADELLNLSAMEIHPPEYLDRVQELFSQVLNEHAQIESEVVFRRKDGTTFSALVSSHEILLDGKRHAAGFFRDLTSQKQMERSLLRSQAIAHMGTWEMDHATGTVQWTPEVYRIFEIDPERDAITYEKFIACVHPEDRDLLGKAYESAILSRKQYEVTYRIVMKDGRIKWVDETGDLQLAADSTPLLSWGTVQDVTIRRERNERILLQSAALEAAANGIVIMDPEGRVEWCNPAFLKMSGFTMEECVEKHLRELQAPDAKKHPQFDTMFDEITSGLAWSGEMLCRRKDGSTYTEFMNVTPILNAGQVSHLVAIKQDISEQKALEGQYLQSQKMESVGRLAAGVAHDFNNMLSVITGYSEMALADLPPEGHTAHSLQQVTKAAYRAAGLTRQLLAFSRRQVLDPKLINVNELVVDMEKMLRRLITEDISLELHMTDLGLEILADPGQIEQVLLNLVVNARDAMPKGGRISIATRMEQVSAIHSISPSIPAGEYVCLSVTDTGCGMSEETLAQIFEPFFTTKEQGKGTGLGLSTVFGIVQQSGGHISVESKLGSGTAFRILFPRATKEDVATKSTRGTKRKLQQRHATILLVEDEDALRAMLCRGLESSGFTVITAANGEEALPVFERNLARIELVITDVIMPRMDGPALTDAIHAMRPETKVLYMSGYTDDALTQHGVLNSDVQLIMKPFTVEALVERISEILADSSTPAASEAPAAAEILP